MGLFASSADVWPPAGFEIRTPGEVFDEGVEHDTRGACATRLAVLVNDADAVYPVRIDPTLSDANWIGMNPSIPGADTDVYAAVVDGSGNLYIGGVFTVVGDVIANRKSTLIDANQKELKSKRCKSWFTLRVNCPLDETSSSSGWISVD